MTSELTSLPPDAELADLVSRYLDNRLDATQRARLETRVQEDPAAMEYLAQRLRFEATLRQSINPQRMEVLESRRMIMEPGSDGPEWSVAQQRSVRIGRTDEPLTLDVSPARKRRVRWLLAAGVLLVSLPAAWLLWPRQEPSPPPPSLVLRNADFEATDLSLSPQGFTSALVDWQDVFTCPEAELVEVSRHSNGRIYAKSGKNAVLLKSAGYLTQQLRRADGSPVKVRDGLTLRLSGWAWIDHPPQSVNAALRVIASGRPATIQYEPCNAAVAIGVSGWQHFSLDLSLQGDLMREPAWVEAGVESKPMLDLNGRDLFLSIDSRATEPILLDDLTIEEVHP
jgi:anti-sigma factor RsiW